MSYKEVVVAPATLLVYATAVTSADVGLTAPTFTAYSESLYVNRSFRLTFEWRFGQMSADGGKQAKKITNDDSGR